ncbi:MAG TPA: hypothetical protein VFQ54_05070, partial [Thermomicrobiales bacterium]|nr:hypothetical protein [Thermomicrobiales bacterium]
MRPDVGDPELAELVRMFEPPDGELDVLTYDGAEPATRWANELADALLAAEEFSSDGGLAFRRC